MGFLGRLLASNLRRKPGFVAALRAHAASMDHHRESAQHKAA
jgi:hypothetical protein